ncbi:peptidoglycan-N-acetylmuramic acid deacetylase [Gracilibacillus halotolerans]|uniref:Peptidoglycan-N-acetylmuramic acid deacetylase n=1 Tax=Gracilibacillus halotolerans TaxID=74386 RepID=A0A841RNS9_9BACI|nr:delta-lactam-biosynthetic de-N-acetylase [Gracilibacillus halotolerans]MBB6513532.1 peptidoglycan-N-acetylmuramic acid deacetylase [Gracilibacillus halotolerans]
MKKRMILFLAIVMFLVPINLSAAGYGWGYKKNSNNEPPEVGKYGQILEEHGGFYMDPSGDKHVYLTFDNGYEAGFTEQVLDVLKEKDVPATFFLTGHYVDDQPALVKRMIKDGHIIGNHSDDHIDFTTASKEKFTEDVERLTEKIIKTAPEATVQYIRPPKGTFNENSLKWANELGYIHMFWSVAFVDWNEGEEKGWEHAYQQVMDQIHPGAIVLMHTVSRDNAESLEHLIDELRKQGYTFKSLDDLMLKQLLPDIHDLF